MTKACSTLIRLLLTVKKTVSNQWLSACSVNNLDKMGRPEGGPTAEKNMTACSVKGALYNSSNILTMFKCCRFYLFILLCFQENQTIFKQHMEELLNVLQCIGMLDHKNSPTSLRTALCFIHKEVKSYLSTTKTDGNTEDCTTDMANDFDSSDISDRNLSDTTNTTPPCIDGESVRKIEKHSSLHTHLRKRRHFTPKESPLVAEESFPSRSGGGGNYYNKKTPKGFLNLQQSEQHDSDFPSQKNQCSTPRLLRHNHTNHSVDFDNEDLRCSLLKGKENLKSTPGISRSPGGTPQRSARSFNLSDAGDFVAFALKKKFLSIRKLYGSPQKFNDDSRDGDVNISID